MELDRGADQLNDQMIVRSTGAYSIITVLPLLHPQADLIGFPNLVAEVTLSNAIETIWLL